METDAEQDEPAEQTGRTAIAATRQLPALHAQCDRHESNDEQDRNLHQHVIQAVPVHGQGNADRQGIDARRDRPDQDIPDTVQVPDLLRVPPAGNDQGTAHIGEQQETDERGDLADGTGKQVSKPPSAQQESGMDQGENQGDPQDGPPGKLFQRHARAGGDGKTVCAQ